MKPIVVALLLIAANVLPCCNTTSQTSPEDQSYVSLVQLISTPERFNGKRIVLPDFWNWGMHKVVCIYMSKTALTGFLRMQFL